MPEHNPSRQIEPHPRGNRTSEVQLDCRIREVERRLLSGAGYSELVVFCGGEFGISNNTAQRYITEANRRIKATHERDRELEIAKAKARYEEVIRLAFEREELAVAINAQRSLDRLLGLDAPDRTEHRITDTLTEFFLELRAGGHQL